MTRPQHSTPTIAAAAAALLARQQRPGRRALDRHFFSRYDAASSTLRAALRIERFSREQVAEVKAAVARHEARQGQAGADPLAGRRPGHYQRLLTLRIQEAVRGHVLSLYRRAQGSWAGGETTVTVRVGDEPAASGLSYRAYSSNGRWSGLNAELSVTVGANWRSEIQREAGLATAGGLLTTHATPIDRVSWQASWVEQSRGFDLKVASGVILRTADGSFVHAKSLSSARRIARTRADLDAQAARALRRAETGNARARARAALFNYDAADLIERYGAVVVTLADSRRAGNCASGTRSWVERHFPGRSEASVAEVLDADPYDPYVLRGCVAAIMRSGALAAVKEA